MLPPSGLKFDLRLNLEMNSLITDAVNTVWQSTYGKTLARICPRGRFNQEVESEPFRRPARPLPAADRASGSQNAKASQFPTDIVIMVVLAGVGAFYRTSGE